MHLTVAQAANGEMHLVPHGRWSERQALCEGGLKRSACLRDGDAGLEAGEGAHGLLRGTAANGSDIDLFGQQ